MSIQPRVLPDIIASVCECSKDGREDLQILEDTGNLQRIVGRIDLFLHENFPMQHHWEKAASAEQTFLTEISGILSSTSSKSSFELI